jgi:hypothetical protein
MLDTKIVQVPPSNCVATEHESFTYDSKFCRNTYKTLKHTYFKCFNEYSKHLTLKIIQIIIQRFKQYLYSNLEIWTYLNICEIWDFQGGDDNDNAILGSGTFWTGCETPAFRRSMLFPSSGLN